MSKNRISKNIEVTTPEVAVPHSIKVIEPGHVFELPNRETGSQRLTFVLRVPSPLTGKETLPLKTEQDGTDAECVILALIDNLQKLNSRVQCFESVFAIYHLECALMNLQRRTEDRTARGVEGKPLP